jgi:hypothetical protein
MELAQRTGEEVFNTDIYLPEKKKTKREKFRPFAVIHIGRSLLPVHNQNLPKSFPAPSHGERSCSKILKGLHDKGQLVTNKT